MGRKKWMNVYQYARNQLDVLMIICTKYVKSAIMIVIQNLINILNNANIIIYTFAHLPEGSAWFNY